MNFVMRRRGYALARKICKGGKVMADIELVIKIPEKTVNEIKDNAMFAGTIPSEILWDVTSAIVNSTPLPKGHGDLKDANKLKHAFIKWSMAVQGNFTDADIASIIYNSPTIIEADKESEDKK